MKDASDTTELEGERSFTHCRVNVWHDTTLGDDDVSKKLVQPESDESDDVSS